VEYQKKIYRAAYILQYFGPTPLTTSFAPLEILYAFPKAKEATTSTYTYLTLFTQPVIINISRIGPYQSPQALAMKEPIEDSRSRIIWTAFALGTGCVLFSVGGWSREGWKKWQQRKAARMLSVTTADTALRTLQYEEALFFRFLGEPSLSVGTRLAQILREYLQVECKVQAFTLTTAELMHCLNGTPFSQEILHLLERCDALKYRPSSVSAHEEQQLWRTAMGLFAQLRKEGTR
jgi:hypothetical protein